MLERIDLFLQLQDLDTAADLVKKQKGTHLQELASLEDNVKTLGKEVQNIQEEIADEEKVIKKHREKIGEAEVLIKRYENDQLSVSSTKEYDTIARELEFQRLEVVLGKKRIKNSKVIKSNCKEQLLKQQDLLKEKEQSIESKKQVLIDIEKKNEAEENTLQCLRKALIKKIKDTTFLKRYESMRTRMSLVIAKVVEEACTGCFIIVPPQTQIEIKKNKKIIICEECRRILAKVELPAVTTSTPTRARRSTLRA